MEFLNLVISGYFSDFVFNVIFVNFLIFIQNNLAILFLSAALFKRLSKMTKCTWDDKLAEKYHNFLLKFRDNRKKGKKNG